jgi:DNA-binding transcriptional ArsR family regulator
VIRFRLGQDDLGKLRFAVSPLWETVASLRVLADPLLRERHRAWVRAVEPRLRGLELEPLRLLAGSAGFLPDFLLPAPTCPAASIGDELACVRTASCEQVRLDLRILFADDVPAPLRALAADPERALPPLVESLERYWAAAVEQHWPRLRALLEIEIYRCARELAYGGPEALFADLHPRLRYAGDGVVEVDKPCDAELDGDGQGLLLVPLGFAWPGLYVCAEPALRRAVAYGPRGAGALWLAERPVVGDALVQLLGRARAEALESLAHPRTTSELARRHGVTPSAASQTLAALRRLGLVEPHRLGRSVLYSLSARGEALRALFASDPPPPALGGPDGAFEAPLLLDDR